MAETTLRNLDIKDFTLLSGTSSGDYVLMVTASGGDGRLNVGTLTAYLVSLSQPYVGTNGNWWLKTSSGTATDTGIAAQGQTPTFKKGGAETAALLWKYENEDDSAYRPLVEWSDLKFSPADLTDEQWAKMKLNFSDLTEEDIAELQRPAAEAAQAALDAAQEAKGAAEGYKAAESTIAKAVTDANVAKALAEESAKIAQSQKDETVAYLNTVRQNESERASAEDARSKAETARATAEQQRSNVEQQRVSAESARAKAETDRKNAWTAWFEDSTNGVKALWTEWFTDAKNSFTSWFGATANEGIRGEVASWFTNAKNAWNSWFGTSSTTGVQGSWNTFNTAANNAESARASAETQRIAAETARANAETTRRNQEANRVSAEQQRAAAESARVSAESTRQSQEAARQAQVAACKAATDLATELNAHPQMQGSNGNWWKWNTETNEYEDTGIIARGGGMYPMVRSRRNHVIWYDSTDGFKERIVRRRNHTVIKL